MKVQAYSLLFVTSVRSAYVPPEPWSVLTPTATWGPNVPALTDYKTPFALLVQMVGSMATDLTDVGHAHSDKSGVWANSNNNNWPTYTTCNLLNQIGDGQVQYPTKKSRWTNTISHVTQVPDGQIQVHAGADVIQQGGDGQIVEPSSKWKPHHTTNVPVITQISDGQVQVPVTTHQPICNGSVWETCVGADSLVITLKSGVLYDQKGRIGAIVANHQFQFDGPPPQAGTIFAKGWSLVPTKNGYKLALGTQTIFYKCLSGSFFNLYDTWIASQCFAVEISILKAIEC